MIPKKITLGLKYSISIDETNRFLKQIHTDLLAYLTDATNSYPNIYNGITKLNFSKIPNGQQKGIFNSYIQVTIQYLRFPLPAVTPIDLDISHRKKTNFNDYTIIDFEYDTAEQTLMIHTLLEIEEFYLVEKYSNKLIIIDLADIDNYNNNNQVLSYTIEDNENLVILKLN